MKNERIENRVIRRYDHSILAGVCSGIGDYFGIDPVFLRILWSLSIFFYGIGILLYAVCWICLPSDGFNIF